MKIITNNKDLSHICKQIGSREFITIDTEFSRDKTYYPKLCLIQIATDEDCYLIDPIAGELDLSILMEVIFNKNIVKVFHSCFQDLEIIFNLTDKIPESIFDTQIAASVCGFGEMAGYDSLVSKMLSINLDKSYRLTDWTRRPLTDEQIKYASEDVIYLVEVYKKLTEYLRVQNREYWAIEEMNSLYDRSKYEVDLDKVWQKIDVKGKGGMFIARLKALAKWREILAMRRNMPRNHVIKDTVLLDVVATNPKKSQEIKFLKNMADLNENDLREVIKILQEAKIDHVMDLCPPKNYSINQNLVSMVMMLLKFKSDEHRVAEKVIATRADIVSFIYEKNTNVKFQSGWRYDIFGKSLERFLNGDLVMYIENKKLKIVSKNELKSKWE